MRDGCVNEAGCPIDFYPDKSSNSCTTTTQCTFEGFAIIQRRACLNCSSYSQGLKPLANLHHNACLTKCEEGTVSRNHNQCFECISTSPELPIANFAGTMCLKSVADCEDGTIEYQGRACKKCRDINPSIPYSVQSHKQCVSNISQCANNLAR